MNTKRNDVIRVVEAAAGENQAPPEATTVVIQVPVNPGRLTDGEVRETLLQMAHTITILDQATRKCAPIENLHASTMASWLRDFTRMNPPIYYGSKTNEDP
ncbi:hypothetical protein EJD97_024797 [Solanum chilense]|uniref:Uncharacterized protein n=1 Tax=Solanum chilense TaxID=4083 RepID=A0A6N2ASC3_SOLCI|nr:hypothetical protein EJD97_024797 [Solanum chilense]